MKSDPQVVMPQRAFDWSPSRIGLVLDLTSAATTLTLEDLPLSPNSTLPEYQLTQEWFDQVVSELRELEESEAAVAAAGESKEDLGTQVDGDVEIMDVAIEEAHERHRRQLG